MRASVFDANGKRCDVYSPMRERFLPPFVVSMDAATRRAVRESAFAFSGVDSEVQREVRRGQWRAPVIGVVTAGLLSGLVGVFWAVMVGVAIAAPQVLGAVRLRCSFHPAKPEGVVAAMIKHGRCPSCAYALSEPDNAVRRCAECGSAWNEDLSGWMLLGRA